MIKLTSLKLRRMSLGVRQIDISIGTKISLSRYGLIENELAEPKPQEAELIESFLTAVQKRDHDPQAPKRAVQVAAQPAGAGQEV